MQGCHLPNGKFPSIALVADDVLCDADADADDADDDVDVGSSIISSTVT